MRTLPAKQSALLPQRHEQIIRSVLWETALRSWMGCSVRCRHRGDRGEAQAEKKKKLTVLTAARESIIYHVGAHGEE